MFHLLVAPPVLPSPELRRHLCHSGDRCRADDGRRKGGRIGVGMRGHDRSLGLGGRIWQKFGDLSPSCSDSGQYAATPPQLWFGSCLARLRQLLLLASSSKQSTTSVGGATTASSRFLYLLYTASMLADEVVEDVVTTANVTDAGPTSPSHRSGKGEEERDVWGRS